MPSRSAKTLLCAVAFVLPAIVQGNAQAQTAAVNDNTVPNDNTNYVGDKLSWSYYVEAKKTPAATTFDYCIAPGQAVRGNKSTLDSADASGAAGTTPTQWLETVATDGLTPPADNIRTNNCPHVASANTVDKDGTLYVSAGDASRAYREGLEYGGLFLPFKLQLSKGLNITGSSSVGPYLGYRFASPLFGIGTEISPIAFVGATDISVTQNSGGTSTSQSLAAVSFGVGAIASIKDSSFQLGFVIGADHTNSSSNYQYNGKPWLAVEIGYSFAR